MLEIGRVIKEERKKNQVTQSELADFCHVTKASVSKWEQGLTYPDISLLPKIAAYFNISIDNLLLFNQKLSKEALRKKYFDFAKAFAQEPFHQVYEELSLFIKKHYHDENVLLQMSILLLNHSMLSDHQEKVLEDVESYLKRLEHLSSDVWMLKQANSLLGIVGLSRQKPEMTLKRLAGAAKPSVGDKLLLAQAYTQSGNQLEARRTIQVLIYEHILEIIGSTQTYLPLLQSDNYLLNETIKRTEGLIELYEIDQLHPNLSLQFYLSAALVFAEQAKKELVFSYLTKYVRVCESDLFPVKLAGDAYFNLLDEWIEALDLGASPPRDDKIIKESMRSALQLPQFADYQDDFRMVKLQERLECI